MQGALLAFTLRLVAQDIMQEGVEVTPSRTWIAAPSQLQKERRARIVDEGAWTEFWKEHGGEKDKRPTVDFTKEMVLVSSMGVRCCSGIHRIGRKAYVRDTPEVLRFILGYQTAVSQPPVPPGHVHKDGMRVAIVVLPRSTKALEFHIRHELRIRGAEVIDAQAPELVERIP